MDGRIGAMIGGKDHTGQRRPRTEAPQETETATISLVGAEAAEAFARLAVELHGAEGLEETVDAVVDFALQAESGHATVPNRCDRCRLLVRLIRPCAM